MWDYPPQLSFFMAFLKVLYLGQFFSSYTLNLSHVLYMCPMYANDTQLYSSSSSSEISANIHNMDKYICDVK